MEEERKLGKNIINKFIGEKFSDSLLGDIFSSYCIGK